MLGALFSAVPDGATLSAKEWSTIDPKASKLRTRRDLMPLLSRVGLIICIVGISACAPGPSASAPTQAPVQRIGDRIVISGDLDSQVAADFLRLLDSHVSTLVITSGG